MMIRNRVVPTVREAQRPTYSSRNAYLDHQRLLLMSSIAPWPHAGALYASGQRHARNHPDEAPHMVNSEPLVNGIDYVSITDAESMNEVEWVERAAMLAVAVHIGGTRLIDNIILGRSNGPER